MSSNYQNPKPLRISETVFTTLPAIYRAIAIILSREGKVKIVPDTDIGCTGKHRNPPG